MARSRRSRRLFGAFLVLIGCLTTAVVAVAVWALCITPWEEYTRDGGGPPPGPSAAEFNPIVVLPGFEPQAITDFPVKPAADVGDAVHPDELVIGVTVGKESRAYPVNMLTGPQREILNDTLGGTAVAATW